MQETISTCRFAQRVAMVNNEPIINIERKPHQEIAYLKAEVERLKSHISLASKVIKYVKS